MPDNDSRLKVVLYWHMHQPHYLNPQSNQYILPWTYLHAIKDYVDMAWYLETIPGARAVVNFTPTLLEQIDDYDRNLKSFLRAKKTRIFKKNIRIKDPLLGSLALQTVPTGVFRTNIIEACLKANQERMIDRYPPFKKLAKFARDLSKEQKYTDYIKDSFFTDLSVWYHLAWLGESLKRDSVFVQELVKQQGNFTYAQRMKLLTIISRVLSGLIGRYKKLAQRGVIELSVTPYAHPIIPLLHEFKSAREAWPDCPLPESPEYPGGITRSKWHIEQGLRVFEHYFGYRPIGCWPAEGSVSDKAAELLAEAGFQWIATGEGVLKHSVSTPQNRHIGPEYSVHRAFDFNQKIHCFFRDDGLSDEIGFNYSDWHADDAVSNLVHHLENIKSVQTDMNNAVVAIILDGENAWEYYPENGYYFLTALYKRLSTHKEIELTTFEQCLKQGIQPVALNHITAGSWVYGSFSTWIGNKDKNLAWDKLVAAKQVFDKQIANAQWPKAKIKRVEKQLAICEGSDWFWWFGDENPSQSVRDFDLLYRLQLDCLYREMAIISPDDLREPISRGGGDPAAGGVMKPGQFSAKG